MTEEMAENRSVWHVKTNADPLLHGGGLCEENLTWQQVVVAGRHTVLRLTLVVRQKMDRALSSIQDSLTWLDTSDIAPHFSLHTHIMYID